MEAELRGEIPAGPGWLYEPKWDGFRCLVFKDGGTVELQSKSGRPLTRYFPEVAAAVGQLPPARLVLDTEIVISEGGTFDDLLQRIHPAASRIEKLARDRPACAAVFDLLVDDGGHSLVAEPLRERRRRLEALSSIFGRARGLVLSPATTDVGEARHWLSRTGLGLDGIVAKRLDEPYRAGERAAAKIKRKHTADCVVGGYRRSPHAKGLGSLLLGLYDPDGVLHHVGFTATFRGDERHDVLRRVEGLRGGAGFSGRAPGGPSRWSERSGDWEPIEPTLVVEVEYDRFDRGRFRHGTRFVRWRPDKDPRGCTLQQVERESRVPLDVLIGDGEKTPAC